MVSGSGGGFGVAARVLGRSDQSALEAFLRRHEETSLFLLGNLASAGVVDRGERCHATYAGSFGADGALEGVAAHAWNRSLLLQAPRGLEEAVFEAVRRSGRHVGGFVGPWEQCSAARRALGLEGEAVQYGREEERMALSLDALVTPPALAEGRVRCRRADRDDVEFLGDWRADMAVESLDARDTAEMRASYRESTLRQAEDGVLYVLEDDRGTPVSTSAFNAMARPAAQVGGVWTPTALRNRGYARAVVAGALADVGRRGVTHAVLFTGSPAARRCYESIGFRVTGGYGLLLLARSVAVDVDPR
jgi:RimJ/RimL family protein N-acetyltransferase